jgi:hypothetical protein
MNGFVLARTVDGDGRIQGHPPVDGLVRAGSVCRCDADLGPFWCCPRFNLLLMLSVCSLLDAVSRVQTAEQQEPQQVLARGLHLMSQCVPPAAAITAARSVRERQAAPEANLAGMWHSCRRVAQHDCNNSAVLKMHEQRYAHLRC